VLTAETDDDLEASFRTMVRLSTDALVVMSDLFFIDRRERSGVRARSVRKGARASPEVVFDAQSPAQPHSGVVVDRPVRFGDGAYIEVVRPAAQLRITHRLISGCVEFWTLGRF
jgi:hypothetical protein